tara:strand:+ start:66570 stop:67445 length:876 start_codon:yes stop_codon:yes gene_type:complete
MATGNYGIVRPADVNNEDIQIFYNYTPSRQTISGTMTELDSASLITDVNGGINSVISGIKNLNLPADIFGSTGIYNILIRPRETNINIIDCGVLSVSPDVKGILFNVSDLPTELASDNSLIGFRVEYFNLETGIKEQNLFRIITSSGRVEPVNQNLNNTNQKAIRYRYNDAGSLVFCTLTPTSTAITLPNQLPFIGQPNQQVTLTNTYFDPIHIELEMVEHNSETLAYALYGNQSKSIQDGIYTIYDNENNIYKQYNLFEVQDDAGNPLFEAREIRLNIDDSKSFSNIFSV